MSCHPSASSLLMILRHQHGVQGNSIHTRAPSKEEKTSLISHHLACPLHLDSLEGRAKETQSMEVRIRIRLPRGAFPSEMLAYQCFPLLSWLAGAHWPAPDSAGILTGRARSHQTSSELSEKTLVRENPNRKVSHGSSYMPLHLLNSPCYTGLHCSVQDSRSPLHYHLRVVQSRSSLLYPHLSPYA